MRNRTPRASKCGPERLKHLAKPETFARCAGCMTDICLGLDGNRYICSQCAIEELRLLRRQIGVQDVAY